MIKPSDEQIKILAKQLKVPTFSTYQELLLFSTLKEAVFVKLNEVKTAWCCVCQSH